MKQRVKKRGRGLRVTDLCILALVLGAIALGVGQLSKKEATPFPHRVLYTLCFFDPPMRGLVGGRAEQLMPQGATVTTESGAATLGEVVSTRLESGSGGAGALLVAVRAVASDTGAPLGIRVGGIRIAAGTEGVFRVGGYCGSAAVLHVEVTEWDG